MSTPLDNPDAIISGSVRGYGRPYGVLGPPKWRIVLNRLLRRRPISQRFLLQVIYRDYTERTTTIHLDPGMLNEVLEKLWEAPLVRQVFVGEILYKSRKSFGADFDPENLTKFLGEAYKNANPNPTQPGMRA